MKKKFQNQNDQLSNIDLNDQNLNYENFQSPTSHNNFMLENKKIIYNVKKRKDLTENFEEENEEFNFIKQERFNMLKCIGQHVNL